MKKISVILLFAVFASCSQSMPGANAPLDKAREYAAALINQELYYQAIEEYKHILDNYTMADNIRANINFQIANVYFEKIGNVPDALTYYLRVRHLYGDSELIDDVNRKVVACLERLGRSNAAAEFLKDAATTAGDDSPFESLPGDTLAVIGDRIITTGDFDRIFKFYWDQQPPEQKKEEPTRDQKLAFFSEYVKGEVLYNSAKLQNLDTNKEVTEMVYLQKKQIMVQKLLDNELSSKINITEDEIATFYNDNKDKFQTNVDGKLKQLTLTESKDYVRQFIFSQKASTLRDELTDRLIEAQNARIFSDRIK